MAAVLAAALLAAGCVTQGEYVEPAKQAAVRQQVTTAKELEAALGSPSLTVPLDDDRVLWVYQGVHKTPGATTFVPYLNLVAGYNNKACTRLTVVVDRRTGALSDWKYASATDAEYWMTVDDKCRPKAWQDAETSVKPASEGATAAPPAERP